MHENAASCVNRTIRAGQMSAIRLLVIALSTSCVSMRTMGQALPCHYDVDLIVGPSCGSDTASVFGAGISDEGHVCGWFQCPGGTEDAFVAWNAGPLIPLTMPPGVTQSRATDINGTTIVGHYASAGGYRGFRIQSGILATIQPLAGGNWVEVARVNSAGVIVGAWGNTVTGPFPRAFRWENGVLQDIAADLLPGESRCYDINNNGAIAGFMGQTAFPNNAHAFIWQNGVVTDLGLMPGSIGTEGRAINSSNQVVGIAWFTSNNFAGYVRRGFFWQNGEFTDLGTLPGYTEIFPYDISDDGTVIVRLVSEPGGSSALSVLWKAGVMRPITPLLIAPPAQFADLMRAINANGQIGGSVDMFNHPNWGARLRPVPRNPGDTNCDTLVNVVDLLAVITSWGNSGVDADLNADFTVNVNDLLLVITNWTSGIGGGG